MPSRIHRFFIYVAIVILSIALMQWIKPTLHFKPTGILLPYTKPLNPTQPSNINLYDEMPPQAKLLGILHVQYHSDEPEKTAHAAMLTFAKKQASRYGANGLVLIVMARSNNPRYPLLSNYILRAKVIHQE